jgi:flavin reductase (DIM6/NTAB) family NADH-FMN oxidoreductase RutF
MIGTHFYEPARGHGLPHDPFKAIVAPRPIGWISTVDREGRHNLAPYSFFNAVADRPPMLMFCSNGWKDSVANCDATRAFVWNLATRPLADAVNESSAPVAHGESEFARTGLTPAACAIVDAPRVAESPASLECLVTDIHRLRDIDGTALDFWLVLGEVVGVHIDRRFLNEDGLFDTAAAGPIQRAGYVSDFFEVGEKFPMTRPKT